MFPVIHGAVPDHYLYIRDYGIIDDMKHKASKASMPKALNSQHHLKQRSTQSHVKRTGGSKGNTKSV